VASIEKKPGTIGKKPRVEKNQGEQRRMGGIDIKVSEYGLLGALVFIMLFFQFVTDGRLLIGANVNNLIMQNAYVVILAIGMVMVIIAGHIDLSVGSLCAMIGAVVALAISQWGLPWPIAVLIALLVGAVAGAWQGFWVAYVGVPAFIVTLGGMLLFRGFALVFLVGGTIGGLPEGFVSIGARWLPPWFGEILDGRDLLTLLVGLLAIAGMVVAQARARSKLVARGLPHSLMSTFILRNAVVGAAIMYIAFLLAGHRGLPYILIILAVLVIAYTFVLSRTVFGRHIYAMGGNRFAAEMSGIKTRRVDFWIFVNIGVLAAIAAVVTTARAGSAIASAGNFFELDAIAAVFIGGASVHGGVGRISGTVIGALIMGVLNQGLSIMGIGADWQQVIKGLVLLVAVGFDVMNRRRSGDS